MKPKPSINQLAWQLRTNTLTLENDRVVLLSSMLQTATDETRAIVQARADEINRIISIANIHPANITELKIFFDDMENRP